MPEELSAAEAGGQHVELLPERTVMSTFMPAFKVQELPPPLPKLNFIGSIVVEVLVGGANFVQNVT